MTDFIPCVIVTGPTATGKTALAVDLARRLDGEIVSADSRQVYRGMNLGTGKDLEEYGEVPYHLIDVVNPDEVYHLAAYLRDASIAIRNIYQRGKTVIICGGTPLWIHALLNRYEMPGGDADPELRAQRYQRSLPNLIAELKTRFPLAAADFKDWENLNRVVRAIEIAESREANPASTPELPQLNPFILMPFYPREVVRERVRLRLNARLDAGMVVEVQALLNRGVTHERLDFFGLEYRYISRYLRGELNAKEMHDTLYHRICQFVKRQDIWFRKFERENWVIHRLDAGKLSPAILQQVQFFLSAK